MPSPPNLTNITPPRVPLIDERTGLISREWYRFFLNLFNLTGGGSNTASLIDLQLGPPAPQQEDLTDIIIDVEAIKVQPTEESANEQIAELQKQVEGLAATPIPALGTFAALQQDNLPWTIFDETPQAIPTTVGTLAWDGGTTLGLQATANVLMQIGESEFVYVKASSAITKGELCYHTGSVGASGVITAAPTPLNLTDPNQIVGVAAESIALNGFGLIQISGTLRGFNTTGSSVGETWADGDPLYYNPAYVGSLTKTKPLAPNQKTYVGEIINAGSGGSGSISIRIVPGSVLGNTDSNVQFSMLANGDLIQYDSALGYWKNVPASTLPVGTATNLAGGLAGSVPYQSAPSTTTFLGIGAAGRWLGSSGTAPQWNAPAALTKTDDTNVTLTLGGSATTALLNAASLTLGWTGQLGLTRGGTNASLTASAGSIAYSTASALALNTAGSSGDWLKSAGTAAPVWTAPAALTKTDDTNVTLTLGGSASTALLNAASLTLGWTGQLAVTRGGTGLATVAQGDILYGSAANTLLALSKNTTATRYLANTGTNNNPAWAQVDLSNGVTGTLPTANGGTGLTSYTANGVVYASSTSALATGSAFTFDGNSVIVSLNSATDAVRITQTGAGNALVVEDSTNPDSTPFLIDTTGRNINGTVSAITTQTGSARVQAAQFASYAGITAGATAANGATIDLARARGSVESPTIVSSGDSVGRLSFGGYDGAAYIEAARITGAVDNTPGLNDMPGRLIFSTTADGAAAVTERVRIDSVGYTQFSSNNVMPYQGAPTSKAAAATLSGAELVTGILNTTGTTYTITLPTGTNIEGALSWVGNNVSLDWWVINTASGTITIGANGNTTLGTLTIATGVSAYFRIRRTAANTFTVYRLS